MRLIARGREARVRARAPAAHRAAGPGRRRAGRPRRRRRDRLRPGPADPQLDLFAEHGVPVVTIEADTERPDFDWHATRTTRGRPDSSSTTSRPPARGGSRSSHRAWPMAWAVESVAAYHAWCAEHGLPPSCWTRRRHRCWTSRSRPTPSSGWWSASPQASWPPRARGGLDVPGDLLVASAMDSAECREGSVPITAADLDPDGLGHAAVDLLLARIRGDDALPDPFSCWSSLLTGAPARIAPVAEVRAAGGVVVRDGEVARRAPAPL